MKEIYKIQIDTNKCKSCSNDCKRKLDDKILCELRNNLTPKLYYEQVPESFAELKKLFLDKLNELNVMWFGDRFVENKSEEFWVKGILFSSDKTLSIRDDNDNIRVIMTNIDYPLMWLFIQTTLNIKSNHIGEE